MARVMDKLELAQNRACPPTRPILSPRGACRAVRICCVLCGPVARPVLYAATPTRAAACVILPDGRRRRT